MERSEVILLLVLLSVLLAALLAAVCIRKYQSEKEMEKYYEAARQMVKEECLNYSLKNPYLQPGSISAPNPRKIMVYVKLVKSGEKGGFVFDPENVIVFGRQKENVSVYINEAVVSQRHCRIFLQGEELLLEDLGSANGTGLLRKRKEYLLSAGFPVVLTENDIVHVGSRYFQIRMFCYDTTMM